MTENFEQANLQDNDEVVRVKGDLSYEPEFTIREMLEAGVHFGHRTARWNAKMQPFIYGIKNELHIIDLAQSAHLLAESVRILREIVKKRGKILFVCTKKQGAEIVQKVAEENGQYFVTNKWLGGMLTNWKTISKSIKTLNEIERDLADENSVLTKKEKLELSKKQDKLTKQLGGIRNMQKLPDIIFVIDTPRESLAIAEAKTLSIPVMAIVDTNSDPNAINYPIPGNDDSNKAIDLYMKIINDALSGIKDLISTNEHEKKGNDDNRRFATKKASKSFARDKTPTTKAKEESGVVVKVEEKLPTTTENKE
ncbi:MAG: 30S ribosomal protein S2 [Rickettsiales bacterium]|jgi:small subunit ribosomal protein S2|nr:30S ribosomal protein S2 [Rickettsiales bacterium]